MTAIVFLLLVQAAIAAATPLLARRDGRSAPFHPAVAFALPYCVITAGPALRYVLFDVVPYGIHLDRLAEALGVAISAQLGILVGAMWATQRPAAVHRYVAIADVDTFRRLAVLTFAAALTIAAAALAARWGTLTTVGKLDAGADGDVWVRLHYAAFLVLLAVIPAVVVADQRLAGRACPPRTAAVVGSFGLLCLVEGERNLALVLLMVPLAWLTFGSGRTARPSGWNVRHALRLGAAFAVVALLLVGLEWTRGAGALGVGTQARSVLEKARDESVLQSILGLGSNLFVVSRVVEWVPAESPFEWGMTYLHTAVNLLPSFVLPELRYESLLTWFKMRYAPTSQSGYGFGMEAEAYLNFGLLGPFVVFALWTRGLAAVLDRGHAQPAALLAHVAFTFMLPFSLYCIRGDSLMCVKGFVYATLLVRGLAEIVGVTLYARRTTCGAVEVPA